VASRILIIDYGSQYTQLIARRVREARVYSEIHPPTRTLDWIREWRPTGIILSGGPNSVYGEDVPSADAGLLDVAPVLGICYGMQLITLLEGGGVTAAGRREYGRAEMSVCEPGHLFDGMVSGERLQVWMSHGDHVEVPPPGYVVTAESPNSPIAAMRTSAADLRRAVPPRGGAHAARGGGDRELPLRVCRMPSQAGLAGAFIHEEIARIRDRSAPRG
jgi:GMP synthase (glutamine-hydrolysing)